MILLQMNLKTVKVNVRKMDKYPFKIIKVNFMEIQKDKNFILTTDEKTKTKLLQNGLTLIGQNGNAYTFVNEPNKLVKFNYAKLKFSFTNKIMF